ncbi:probable serine/threonine-protein kinase DDB_G0290621 [Microplitis mediator]|uniref:probable serine/threonine-protein kinase DDB_G0290621 n=1 Tax=Microplitis mediator TaxID=375433 RepID=UPI00255267E8|nr:probable serine/threonine-protein kinase DDB_G0290621 [Microplitis mediator]
MSSVNPTNTTNSVPSTISSTIRHIITTAGSLISNIINNTTTTSSRNLNNITTTQTTSSINNPISSGLPQRSRSVNFLGISSEQVNSMLDRSAELRQNLDTLSDSRDNIFLPSSQLNNNTQQPAQGLPGNAFSGPAPVPAQTQTLDVNIVGQLFELFQRLSLNNTQQAAATVPQTVTPGNSFDGGERQSAHLLNAPTGLYPNTSNYYEADRVTYAHEKKWRDIHALLKVWTTRYPQGHVSANSFLASAEATAFRENWSEDDLLKIMAYLLIDKASEWYNKNYLRWENYNQFKRDFLRTYGSQKTDTQILLEIVQTKPNENESPVDFVFRMQSKYWEMKTPPPVKEQVEVIQNHLPNKLRTLIFSRAVEDYDSLLETIHKASQSNEENSRLFDSLAADKSSAKPKEKTRLAALQDLPGTRVSILTENQTFPLVIEEIREEAGGLVVCASASNAPQSYARNNNQPRHSQRNQQQDNRVSYPYANNNYPRSYKEVTNNMDNNHQNTFNPPSGDFCFNCGQYGHEFVACTNIRIDVCTNCFRSGHVRQNCRKLFGQAQSNPPAVGSNNSFYSQSGNHPNFNPRNRSNRGRVNYPYNNSYNNNNNNVNNNQSSSSSNQPSVIVQQEPLIPIEDGTSSTNHLNV